MTFSAPHVLLITGIMAAGKSTIAQAVAERLPNSVHLRGDLFRRMIVNGESSMDPDDMEALSRSAEEQLRLRYRIAASAATLYAQAGFTVVYQDIIIGSMLTDVIAMLPAPLSLVVLCPAPDVAGQRDQARHKTGYSEGGWTPQQLDDDLRQNTPRLGLWLDNSALSIEETVSAIFARADEALVRSIRKHEHLYQVPLQALDLSSDAISSLQKAGLPDIGSCIDFYIQEKQEGVDVNVVSLWGLEKEVNLEKVPIKHHFYLYTDVREKLKKMDYWHFVEDAKG